jgi:hypothetical protein
MVDESGVVGTVSLSRLQKALTEEVLQQSLRRVLPAGEFPHVNMDHSLAMALDRMGSSQLDCPAGSQSRQRTQARRNYDSTRCLEALRRGPWGNNNGF